MNAIARGRADTRTKTSDVVGARRRGRFDRTQATCVVLLCLRSDGFARGYQPERTPLGPGMRLLTLGSKVCFLRLRLS